MTTFSGHATMTVAGRSWEETRAAAADAVHAVARATFTTSYSGDLVGESTCCLLICYVDGDPDQPETLVGPYVGYEQVTGTLAGRTGSFVLAARGDHHRRRRADRRHGRARLGYRRARRAARLGQLRGDRDGVHLDLELRAGCAVKG